MISEKIERTKLEDHEMEKGQNNMRIRWLKKIRAREIAVVEKNVDKMIKRKFDGGKKEERQVD